MPIHPNVKAYDNTFILTSVICYRFNIKTNDEVNVKRAVFFLLLVVLGIHSAGAIERPKVHAEIMVDGRFFFEGNANDGQYDTTDRYQIRSAAVTIDGKLPHNVEYFTEFGLSTCTGSGTDLKIMNAGVVMNITDSFHMGIAQDHVLRGFAATTECSTRLTLEKPNYVKTFGACHPLGFMMGGYTELPAGFGLEYELAICNGKNGTLDGEHDYVFGTKVDLPLDGFSLAASYNHTAANYFDEAYEEYSEDGYRYNIGVNYEKEGIWFTSEFSQGEGFSRDDQEMQAWYAQLGYHFKLNTQKTSLTGIQPYVMYENWDKDVDGDAQYTFLQSGINLKVSPYSQIKFCYRKELDQANGVDKTADSFVIRIQAGL